MSMTLMDELMMEDPVWKKAVEDYRNDWIDVRTARFVHPAKRIYLKFSDVISRVTFARPLNDFKGNENERVDLRVRASCGEYGGCWMMTLIDGRGYGVLQNFTGEINFPLSDVRKERLEAWQERGFELHDMLVERIRDIYWSGGIIDKDFLYVR